MKLINKSSDTLTIVSLDQYQKFDKLQPWIYKNPEFCDATKSLSLTKSEALFDIPETIYGNTTNLADAILKDYDKEGGVLGALLVGKKGMGKSLLSEKISIQMIEQDIPVIHVTRPVSATAIEKAIEILAPCVLYLEEFEKCFTDPSDVPIFLNMFSSTTIKGLMVIIAANSIDNVMYGPLLDRPQRLRYRINYNEIDDTTVDQILSDKEVSDAQRKVYTEWVKSSKPNIDSLITLVKLTKHISNQDELVDYIGILNVPRLNSLRYVLTDLTIIEWNYMAVDRFAYTVTAKTVANPGIFTLEMNAQAKLKGTVDLTVDENNLKPFTSTLVMADESKEDGARIVVEASFGLTRDDGDIKQPLQVSLNSEFKKPLEIIKGRKHVEGNANKITDYYF